MLLFVSCCGWCCFCFCGVNVVGFYFVFICDVIVFGLDEVIEESLAARDFQRTSLMQDPTDVALTSPTSVIIRPGVAGAVLQTPL